jgi:hypothetical protein
VYHHTIDVSAVAGCFEVTQMVKGECYRGVDLSLEG